MSMSAEVPLDCQARSVAKRRKVSLACESCRNRKSRCDGIKPQCQNCAQRCERCVYRLPNPHFAETNEYIESLVTKIGELEGEIRHSRDASRRAYPTEFPGQNYLEDYAANQESAQNSDSNTHSEEALVFAAVNDQPNSESAPTRTVLVDSSSPVDGMGGNNICSESLNTGEKFYGISSSMSFVKLFYNMTSRNSHSSASAQFNPKGERTQLDETQTTNSASQASLEIFALLPRAIADHLLDIYWNKVYHVYPYIHRATFMAAYEQLWAPASAHKPPNCPRLGLGGSESCGFSSSVFHCALNAMMVLGVQFSDLPLAQKTKLSLSLTERAKSQFDLEMFEDGNIYVIQTLLLLAQVFQFTTYPTRCWSAIGAACRLAQGLGLHLAEDRLKDSFEPVEIELRKRIWHSCSILDLIVSITLGRPALLRHGSTVALPAAIDDEYLDKNVPQPPGQISTITFFVQAAKLYTTLGKIFSKVYGENETEKPDLQRCLGSIDQLIELDAELSEFAEEVPDALSWTKESTEVRQRSTQLAQQSNILRARYLHLRILLYRPCFTHFCRSYTSKKVKSSSKRNRQLGSEVIPLETSIAQCCAVNCLRSAVDLVDLTEHYAATTEYGAWWYSMYYIRTAALVILLADTCAPLRDSVGASTLASSWQKCRISLLHRLPQVTLVQNCLQTLEKMYERVLKIRAVYGQASFGLVDEITSYHDNAPVFRRAEHGSMQENQAQTSFGNFRLEEDYIQTEDYVWNLFTENEFNIAVDDHAMT
ncbi:uncharacterized protein PV09_03149 [Verruconis gallopava]|uniref:Zn(2)-C6 fungal-type domain-containing protein n=1 Tax=Verruconis gallopava TaxID=253628 RepID=A0A0D2B426_9PEZI|nr:uncharacterized protein PV09_03149 [Verruconis gallopava]KIW05964.1 hypothetical protein PV09_03149 [Verruconis gallopava]